MVGAGSFGRVFHGAMGDQEVAIKVINHSGQTAKQVGMLQVVAWLRGLVQTAHHDASYPCT